MGKVLIDESILQGWADVVREKQGIEDKMKPSVLLEKTREIGQSGSSGLPYDMGEFVLDEDVKSNNATPFIVKHNLGDIPSFILIWTDDFADLSVDNVSPYSSHTNIGYIWFNGLTKIDTQRATSTVSFNNPIYVPINLQIGDYRVAPFIPTSNSYAISIDNENMPTKDDIKLTLIGNNNYWRAGVTYKYFVSRNWWEVSDNVE